MTTPTQGDGSGSGGFGGYDPNKPPPGHDPLCWRASNWDYARGLICYVSPTDGSTTLRTDLRTWLPWTWDLGQYPPPANSAWAYARSQGLVLPHPGPLTQAQAMALYAEASRSFPLTDDAFNALVAKVKAANPHNPNVIETPVADPTPKGITTFDNGVTYDGEWYYLPDGTKVATAAEAGVGPKVTTPPPTTSGAIPPAPTGNVEGVDNTPSVDVRPVTQVVTATPSTGGQAPSGGPIPVLSTGAAPKPSVHPVIILAAVAFAFLLFNRE